MITKNKFQKLLEKISLEDREEIVSKFKEYCLFNFYPSRYYENLYKNFKIVKNNYNFINDFLYKAFKIYINDSYDLYHYNNNFETIGFIGVIQEKSKPKLVAAFKNKVMIYNSDRKYDTHFEYYFLFIDPKYIKKLIEENKIIFKGD